MTTIDLFSILLVESDRYLTKGMSMQLKSIKYFMKANIGSKMIQCKTFFDLSGNVDGEVFSREFIIGKETNNHYFQMLFEKFDSYDRYPSKEYFVQDNKEDEFTCKYQRIMIQYKKAEK